LQQGPSGHQIMQNTWFGGFSIPQVTIKTGLKTPDGREELLAEYFCDHPGCHNIATHVLGCTVELCLVAVVCKRARPEASVLASAAPRNQFTDRFSLSRKRQKQAFI
jgi:hypothetical protein